MSQIDEPAFPVSASHNRVGDLIGDPQAGMTLRDYFAAHAPPMPLAVIHADPWTGAGHLQILDVIEKEIWWRWHYADQMLAARKIASE